jgi:HlyD family secretion protein
MKSTIKRSLIIVSLLSLVLGLLYFKKQTNIKEDVPLAKVEPRSFAVEVKTVGELEAARSTIIASSVKGDQGKIIYLITDGINVKPGDILLKMDPTPFEEKLTKLKSQIQDQEAYIENLQQALAWEKEQVEHENKTADFEVESSQLELNKIKEGDGPQEISRLHSLMQKAWLKYEEFSGYTKELLALEELGYLNPPEIKQAQKQLSEEQEAYEATKSQYDSFITHVYPMQVKKAETHLKRTLSKKEEVIKAGQYKVAKAQALLEQAYKTLNNYKFQLKQEEKELEFAEIKAPFAGMIVHREEYRSSQKRKPRIGDILVKNQPLMDLPDLNSMIVKTKVREVDLYKVAVGKEATLQVDAYPHLTFMGKVSSIGVLAMSDLMRASEEKYFEVRIALNQGDERLRPGMTARVAIHASHVEEQLSIPLHAIFEENQHHYCYVKNVNGYEKRPIEVGICNEHWGQVHAGLNEGDLVTLMSPGLEAAQ